jgi:segregation and condensation protein A
VEAIQPLDSATIAGYQLRLPSFEGPLDILLRLIERSQLQITDVSLVAVMDQFLVYVASLDQAGAELIADFTNVATRLVLLKSRSLLPRPPAADQESEHSDLVRELVEYRAVKQAAFALADKDRRGEGAFLRPSGTIAAPEPVAPPRMAAHEASWLARAIRRRFMSIPSPRAIVQAWPVVSLREVIEHVLHSVSDSPYANFSAIARECRDAHELRTTFLAVLVLIRRRAIDVEQNALFGEIVMRRAALRPVLTVSESIAFSADD